MPLILLALFFVDVALTMFLSAWLAAELKSARPDMSKEIGKPWLVSTFNANLLRLSRRLLEHDTEARYVRIGRLSTLLSITRRAQWVLLGAALLASALAYV